MTSHQLALLAVLAVLLLVVLDAVMAAGDTFFAGEKLRLVMSLGSILVGDRLIGTGVDDEVRSRYERFGNHSGGAEHRSRTRNYVHKMFDEYGPYYAKRAYRMPVKSFWRLHVLLRPYMIVSRRSAGTKRKRGAKNGTIGTQLRLSAALRYFAGGRPDDISISHGISHSEVFNSVWIVVDAVNKCPTLAFSYPSDYNDQKRIAAGFAKKSRAGFDCCAGAIDCMLAWIEKPNSKSCRLSECGAPKFYCGRKHKYGICLQAVCDSDCKFLDVSLGHPASTSDFMAFTSSKIGGS